MRLALRRLTIGASTAVLGLLLTFGCSGEQSPLAQDPDADSSASVEAGQSILTFSSPGLRPAAKKGDGDSDDGGSSDDDSSDDDSSDDDSSDDDSSDDGDSSDDDSSDDGDSSDDDSSDDGDHRRGRKNATKTIDDEGGQLQITDDGGEHRKLVVTLDVPNKALDDKESIAMEISGGRLSELVIRFSPAGLVFKKHARLCTTLEKELYSTGELAGLIAQHFDGDGNLIESFVPDVTIGANGTVTITMPVPGFSRYGLR